MSQMDHAAAHERIEDLLLEPARLSALDASRDPDDVVLREHLAGCSACRADLDGWRRLQAGLAIALPAARGRATVQEIGTVVETLERPPSLRTRVLGAVRDPGAATAPVSLQLARARRGRRIAPWVGLAASLIVLVGAVVITVDQVGRRAAADRDAAELAAVVAAMDAILVENHKIVALQRPDGSSAGSISWSRHDWVVLTGALDEPPAGQLYKCWLEDAGTSVAVGEMEFAGGTAYWVETVDDWQTWEIGDETRFVVTLEPEGAQQRAGPIILSADLRP
jgi:hypothetical protein